ncbi:MAG TPA: winged helix-turn-helix domain-containing protein, partial [Bellilinea sp.]|nr:winged helix-turn-helix domain-containing protein [Bellilinea sp.]
NEMFDILGSSITKELEKVQQLGAEYFMAGEALKARDTAAHLEKIKGLGLGFQTLRSQYMNLIPNLVLDEVSDGDTKWNQRTPDGMLTPYEKFRLPTLTVLSEMGGRARAFQVMDRVGKLMVEILNKADREIMITSKEPHWRNRNRWARQDMVEEGLLEAHPGQGIWQITEKGREYLRNRLPED